MTPELIRQAYVEALYHVNEWDYTRITEVYWQRLIYEASRTGSHLNMLKKHPMEATDVGFTRPIIPFDCEAMGGCGPGTLRVPKKSCAIDFKADYKTYDWMWYENWQEEGKRIEREKEKQKKLEIAKLRSADSPGETNSKDDQDTTEQKKKKKKKRKDHPIAQRY